MAACGGCGGTGQIEVWRPDGAGGSRLERIACYSCNGSGQSQ